MNATSFDRRPLRIASLALPLLLLGFQSGCGCRGKQAVADLTLAEGRVNLERAGDTRSAEPEPLFVGDAVVTGAASHALVRFTSGSEVEVAERSRFVVRGSPVALSLELTEGVVTYRGSDSSTVNLEILTPFGLTRVPGHGGATLAVSSEGMTIEVSTGEITFISGNGQEQRVASGEKIEVKLGTLTLSRPGADAGAAAQAEPPDAGAEIVLAPIEVTLAANGPVQVRESGEKRFHPISGTAPLAPDSELAVGVRSSAKLSAPGLDIELASGSKGRLGHAVREGDKQRYELAMTGESRVLLGAGSHEVAFEGDRGEILLRSSEENTLLWERGRAGASLQVQAGRVELVFGGEAHPIEAGETARIQGTVSKLETPKPKLALAGHKRASVYSDGLENIGLSWPVTSGPVQVQVASDPAFEDLLVSGKVSGNSISFAPPRIGRLFWRVRDLEGQTLHDGQIRFARESALTSSGNPRNQVAETGQKAVVYYQGSLPELDFSFPAVEGAAKYRFRVFRAGELATPIVERIVPGTRCELKAGLLGEGSYLWHAAALGATGAELSGGRMNKLEIAYDNAMTELIIERPRPGERASGTVPIKGIAPLDGKLFVNGKPVPLDGNGRFDQTVPATPTLIFRLVAKGNEGYWMRSLRAQ